MAIAECKGTLVLRARIKKGIRFILVKVGEADFDFFGGQKKVVTVTFNAAGRKADLSERRRADPAVASAANKNRVVRLMQKGFAPEHSAARCPRTGALTALDLGGGRS